MTSKTSLNLIVFDTLNHTQNLALSSTARRRILNKNQMGLPTPKTMLNDLTTSTRRHSLSS